MAGRNPQEAVRNALNPMERAVGCIARQPLTLLSRPPHRLGSILVATIGSASPVKFKTRFGYLWITIVNSMRIVEAEAERGPYRMSTVSYVYSIAEDQNADQEILTYHWDRDAVLPLRNYPHAHVGACALNELYRTKPRSMQKLHIRTDRISIEGFVYMLITEFGVKPIRSNWRPFLESGHQEFHRYRMN